MKQIFKVIIKFLSHFFLFLAFFYMGRISIITQIYSISLHDKKSIESAFNSIESSDERLFKVIIPYFVYSLAIIGIIFLLYAIFYNLRNRNIVDKYDSTNNSN